MGLERVGIDGYTSLDNNKSESPFIKPDIKLITIRYVIRLHIGITLCKYRNISKIYPYVCQVLTKQTVYRPENIVTIRTIRIQRLQGKIEKKSVK
jgi:hypothetical protein